MPLGCVLALTTDFSALLPFHLSDSCGNMLVKMCKSLCIVLHMHACSVAQSYLTLCHPMDCSLPGISVHAISQEGILEWVACPPGDLPSPGIKPTSPTLQADFFFFFFLKPLCYQGSSTELYRDRLSGTS